MTTFSLFVTVLFSAGDACPDGAVILGTEEEEAAAGDGGTDTCLTMAGTGPEGRLTLEPWVDFAEYIARVRSC